MLEVYPYCSESHLQVSANLCSYLWFVTSLQNIQQLPAKALQLREADSGKEEGVVMTVGQGTAGNRVAGTRSTEEETVLQKVLQNSLP